MENTPNQGQAPKSHVQGPDGDVLTIGNLPAARPGRWVASRKAEVIAAVRGGLISLDDACRRYELTPEEFFAWQRALQQFGLRGLDTTNQRARFSRPRGEKSPSFVAAAVRARAALGWR